jgi:hypothetical protein
MLRAFKPEFITAQLVHSIRDAIQARKSEDDLGL